VGGRAGAVEAVDVAVVVPTHARPLRLRFLLNALEEQDLEPDRFEVVVAHATKGTDPEVARVLREHPLGPRVVEHAGGPAALRNAGWRATTAPLVAFTDDDCRPPSTWLRAYVEAAGDAILQGPTRPDPDELGVFQRAPQARSQEIDPPTLMGQTCNIAYPRAALERLGGFDERFPQAVGEDSDLLLRARAAGIPHVAVPGALTYHAVETGLRRRLRSSWRWQHMALLVARHPELRRHFPLRGLAWKASHARALLALAGLAAAPRAPAAALLALPYAAAAPRRYGTNPRALARTAAELPGTLLIDAVETAALLRGSARHRTLLL